MVIMAKAKAEAGSAQHKKVVYSLFSRMMACGMNVFLNVCLLHLWRLSLRPEGRVLKRGFRMQH